MDQFAKLLLVSDTYNHRIRLVDLNSSQVTKICGSGIVGDPGHNDGDAKFSKLNFPQKICLTRIKGRPSLLISELNDCIRILDV